MISNSDPLQVVLLRIDTIIRTKDKLLVYLLVHIDHQLSST
jgi:hypothetical protein